MLTKAQKVELLDVADSRDRSLLDYVESLITAAEHAAIERCAKVCDGVGKHFMPGFSDVATECAATIRASSQPAPVTDGWMPIESAPKGLKVLAGYHNSFGLWRTVMAKYYGPNTLQNDPDEVYDDDDAEFAPEGWYELCETLEHIQFTDEPPTHWQPLPQPPSQPAKGEA